MNQNRYIALEISRKSAPRIIGSTEAPDVREAVRKMNLWPYVFPTDFIDENDQQTKTWEEAHNIAVDHITKLEHGNGDDGYWNVYLEIQPDGKTSFAHHKDKKEVL